MNGKTLTLSIPMLLLLSLLAPGATAAPGDTMSAPYTASGVAVGDVDAHAGCVTPEVCLGSAVFALPNGTTFVVISIVDDLAGSAPFEACLIGVDDSVTCSGIQCVPSIGFGAGASTHLIVYVYALFVEPSTNEACVGTTGTVSVTAGTN